MSIKNNIKFFRIVLAVGFLFILIGINFMILFPSKKIEGFIPVLFFILMIFSSITSYIAILTKKSLLLYFGMNLFVYSVGALIIKTSSLEFSIIKLWPIMMISFGLTLIPCEHFKLKKLKVFYVVPSIGLTFLGLVFLLFAYDIITISFFEFVSLYWPVLLVLAGIVLISLYFAGQTLHLPFPDEDSLTDSMENIDE